jgi:hypothetical protein
MQMLAYASPELLEKRQEIGNPLSNNWCEGLDWFSCCLTQLVYIRPLVKRGIVNFLLFFVILVPDTVIFMVAVVVLPIPPSVLGIIFTICL